MRVVVTGLGLVTPLGVGVDKNWQNLIRGRSGIRSTERLGQLFASLPSRVAAWIDEADLDCHTTNETRNKWKSLPKYIRYALVAAEEAINSSDIRSFKQLNDKVGVCIGSGMGPLDVIGEANDTLMQRGARKISPHLIPRILPNMAAGHVSIHFGIRGPSLAPSTACATGTHAIGDAFRLIRHGYAKVMVAGATEAAVNPLSMAGFCQARALSTSFNDQPEASSRPFDRNRDGFVIGEGAGVLVLEELSHAMERGREIYGEILGYGCSSDAHHITASQPDGLGAEAAMRAAMEDARVDGDQVDYVNAHATSTPIGDSVEAKAISRLFGRATRRRPMIVSSNKGAIGHLLGAAGAVESIYTILSLYHDALPPTLNFTGFDQTFTISNDSDDGIEALPQESFSVYTGASLPRKEGKLEYALKNSFGFGGTNASLCFASYSK